MFKNIHTRYKILVNMLVTQVAFAIISITAIVSASDIVAILAINILFGIIVAYTNFAAMKRIVGGIDRLREYLDDFMQYAFMKSNKIRRAEYIKKDEIGEILKSFNVYFDSFDKIRKDDMRVLGEIVLVMNKVEQGIFQCRVNSNTENPMIMTLKKTINKMLDTQEDNMKELENTLESYSNDDYTKQILISPKLKARMLSVMKGVNALGEALATTAKTNLSNGTTLDKNSD
ncbi:chemotaxis protein, partial [Malaciobacter canalis]